MSGVVAHKTDGKVRFRDLYTDTTSLSSSTPLSFPPFLSFPLFFQASHLLIWCHLPYIPIITTFALTFAKMGLGTGLSVGKFLLCYD